MDNEPGADRQRGIHAEIRGQLACGEIILFPDKKQVYKNEKEIILTAREYQLLEYLMYNQGNVLTKENILEYVW